MLEIQKTSGFCGLAGRNSRWKHRNTFYTPWGAIDRTEDPEGHTTAKYHYGPAHELLGSEDGEGHVVRFRLDEAGNRVGVTDENGNETKTEFDLENRPVATVYADGSRVSLTLDRAGRRIASTNARGATIVQVPDRLGRVTSRSRPEGTDSFSYDPAGRLRLAQNALATEVFDFDERGMLSTHHATIDGAGFTLTHQRDPSGNPITSTDGYGRATQRSFDTRNRLASVTPPRGGVFTIQRNRTGQEKAVESGDGYVLRRTFDCAGRVESLEVREQLTGKLMVRFDYRYDRDGNRSQDTETRPGKAPVVTVYRHNRRHELISAEVVSGDWHWRGFRKLTFVLDAAGNRLRRLQDGKTQVATYGVLNQLLTLDGAPVLTDADGNLLREPLGRGKARAYSWDSENRMLDTQLVNPHQADHGRGSRDPDRAPRHRSEFAYGPQGLKLRVKSFPGDSRESHETDLRFWSGGGLAEELRIRRGEGERGRGHDDEDDADRDDRDDCRRGWHEHHREDEHDHDHGSHRRGELRVMIRGAGGSTLVELSDTREGEALRAPKNPTKHHAKDDRLHLQDVLGSTIATLLPGARDLIPFAYTPEGRQVRGDSDTRETFAQLLREPVAPGESDNRDRHAWGDDEAGDDDLLSAQHRQYRPGLARWTSRDPAYTSENLFSYANVNPLSGVDPSGLVLRVLGDADGDAGTLAKLLNKYFLRYDGHKFGTARSRLRINRTTGTARLELVCSDQTATPSESLLAAIIASSKITDLQLSAGDLVGLMPGGELAALGGETIPHFTSFVQVGIRNRGEAWITGFDIVLSRPLVSEFITGMTQSGRAPPNALDAVAHEFLHVEHFTKMDADRDWTAVQRLYRYRIREDDAFAPVTERYVTRRMRSLYGAGP